jgi:DNA-binding LacI/PurR family transcriptional regulator
VVIQGRRVTLQTIADRLGVSRTTVSNAYNRPDQLGAQLREAILAEARALGYPGPSAAGRSLRTGQRNSIGVLYGARLGHGFSDPASLDLFKGIAGVVEATGSGLTFLPWAATASDQPVPLNDIAVDGYIVYGVRNGHPVLDAVTNSGLPYVMVDQPRPDMSRPFVGLDDRIGAELAMLHLVNLGHRHIGVLAFGEVTEEHKGGLAEIESLKDEVVRERLRGYRDGIAAAALDPASVTVWTLGANSPKEARAATIAMLDAHSRITAVVAMSDQAALGVMHVGWSVPDQLSVVGFDDIAPAATMNPPLTTIRQPIEEKGRNAGWLILSAIAGTAPQHRIFSPELVVRSSTGPPRQSPVAD